MRLRTKTKRRCVEGGAQYLIGGETFDRLYARSREDNGKLGTVACHMCGKRLALRHGPMGLTHYMIPPHNKT